MHLSVFDRKKKTKKNNLILGVWLFPVDCISSWVALQWPVCAYVFMCVWTGYRLPSEKRSWGNSQLPCIVAANTQSAQPGPPAGPVPPPCGHVLSIYLIFFVFLLLLLSVCSDNFDPALSVSSLHLLPLKNANQLTFVSLGAYKKRFKSENHI